MSGELGQPRKHRGEEAAGDGVVRGMYQHDDQHAAPGVVEHPVEDDLLREINSVVNG